MTPTGPTVAELKAEPVSLWDFLAALPTTFEAQVFYGMLIASALGLMGNYIVKWMNKDIAGNLVCYLFFDNPRGTIKSVALSLAGIITYISAHLYAGENDGFVGWGNVLWFGVLNGFFFDSIANKGQALVWTPEQRTAERLKITAKALEKQADAEANVNSTTGDSKP